MLKKLLSAIASAALATGTLIAAPAIIAPTTAAAADGCGDTTEGMTLGAGIPAIQAQTVNQAGAKEETIAAIRAVRQDALDSNIPWPDKDSDTTLSQYLASSGMSKDKYLNNFKWSYDLERIALQRAVEAGNPDDGHTRLNGTSRTTVKHNDVSATSENLSWGQPTFTAAINQFAEEKSAWVDPNSNAETIHYKLLIDPNYLSYGMGQASSVQYGTDHALVGSYFGSANVKATEWQGECNFTVMLDDKHLLDVAVDPVTVAEGETATASITPNYSKAEYAKRFTLPGTY